MCTSNSIDPNFREAPVTDIGNHPQIQQELAELTASSRWVEAQKVIQREVCYPPLPRCITDISLT